MTDIIARTGLIDEVTGEPVRQRWKSNGDGTYSPQAWQPPSQIQMGASTPVSPLLLTVQRTGMLDGKAAFLAPIIGKRDGSSGLFVGNAFASAPTLTDIVEFPLPATYSLAQLAPTGQAVEIVSDNAQDNSGGTGARQITISYLDAAGASQRATVVPNGTTPVRVKNAQNVDIAARAVNLMYNTVVGSGGVAAGNIMLRVAGGGANLEQITAGGNRSLSARYTVPAGHMGYIVNAFASATGNMTQDIRIRAQVDPETNALLPTFLFQDEIRLAPATVSPLIDLGYRPVPALAMVKASTLAGGQTGTAQVSFKLLVVKQ